MADSTEAENASIEQLPDDILVRIIHFVPPEDNLDTLQLLSHRICSLATNQLLWKRHCLDTFEYWHSRHNLAKKSQLAASEVDWKALFILRRLQNQKISKLLNHAVRTRQSRITNITRICHFGYDAKDFLLSQIRLDDSVEDILARRQFSLDALGSIHRREAVREWQRVRDSPRDDPEAMRSRLLERSLTAFDMFVLYDDVGDIDEISAFLDGHAARFIASQTSWDTMSTREKALALNSWLRDENLTGITNRGDFHNLRNSLIGQAIRHEDHNTNPNISSSIFCSIAGRVGINAQCYLAPMMVHTVVLDLSPVGASSTTRDYMFLDPWGSEGEIPFTDIEELTARFGLAVEGLIGSGTAALVTERTSNNIENCCVQNLRNTHTQRVARLLKGHDVMNLYSCLYSVKWVRALFSQPYTLLWNQRVADLLRFAVQNWPEDSWFIQEYAMTLPSINIIQPALSQLETFQRDVMAADQAPISEYQDTLSASRVAPFKIGQVFSHRRFGWIGVITGFYTLEPPSWEQFDADGEVMAMTSEEEEEGRFYVKCLRGNSLDQPVIAPGNIAIIKSPRDIIEPQFPIAGKFFKKYDSVSCQFVSNIKEEYPNL